MYERYVFLRDQKGVKDIEVSRATGIIQSTFSDWKKGKSKPKTEKLEKLADYFGVTVDFILGKDIDESAMPIETQRLIAHNMQNVRDYYTDPATAEMMQKLFESPGRRALFNAVADMDEESVQKYADFIERITHDNNQSN